VICGYRIEDIQTKLTGKVRYLDKLIEELARGRKWKRFCGLPNRVTPFNDH